MFAVMTAGLFPILHLGRPWKFFWLIPYPNWRLIWPNFKSPLVWDVFAILTYLTISSDLLLRRADPRHRGRCATARRIRCARRSSRCSRSAGATRIASGGTSRARTCSSPRSPRRWCSRCTPSCRSTSRWRSRRAGTRRSSRRTSSPARSSRASAMVFTIIIPIRKCVQARALRHAQPPRRRGEALPVHVDGRRATRT